MRGPRRDSDRNAGTRDQRGSPPVERARRVAYRGLTQFNVSVWWVSPLPSLKAEVIVNCVPIGNALMGIPIRCTSSAPMGSMAVTCAPWIS